MPVRETTILIIDDDQLHLTLYTWILQRQGYICKTALVKSTSVDLPKDAAIDLVLLDYRLNSSLTAVDVIQKVKSAFASVPVVVLSELHWMPDDMKDHAIAFINKGDPKRLVATINEIVQAKFPDFFLSAIR
jgi:DNA-binding NtrC family response regulator